MPLAQTSLHGELVHLEPLERRHFDAVRSAALSNPSLFAHIPYAMKTREDIERMLATALDLNAKGGTIVFATCAGEDRRFVGMTAIRSVDPNTPSVEIGSTWIVPSWQRTRVNTEAKYLQLTHCFETLGVARVELKTDARNERSQIAIRRIGATEEGTFRRHMRRHDGTLRDSVYFSIIAEEWPRVRSALLERLAREERVAG
jgi:RimJ/RimL family protein N-acetyltransferase